MNKSFFKRCLRIAVPLSVCAITVGMAESGRAEVLDFSFSNVNGSVSGTVTGEIFLPTACQTGCSNVAATDIEILTDPAALGFPSTPFDLFSYFSGFGETTANKFSTDPSGNLTSADYDIIDGRFGGTHLEFTLDFAGSINVLEGANGSTTENTSGFAGVTYTQESTAPEPGTWAMLLLGFGGLASLRMTRRAK